MNNEIGLINSDLSTYGNLNRTFESLTQEIQNLEGELADYNLASDKYRSQMKAEDIEEVYNKVKMYNQRKMEESDNLYLENAQLKDTLMKIEQENNKVMQEIELRLNDLDPGQKNEYEALRDDSHKYVSKIYGLRENIARMTMELIEGESFLKDNQNKKEAHIIKEAINGRLRKKNELELQTNESGLSVGELKAKLVAQVKEETIEKGAIDKKINDVKKIIENLKKGIIEVEKEMKISEKNDTTKAVDSISQKDKEYSNFIENYPNIKTNLYKEIKAKEDVIVGLLENISTIILSGDKPLENGGVGIKDQIREKKDLIEKSVSTLEEAKAKYEELLIKLERLDTLDETLKKDIKGYRDKLDFTYNEISIKFDKIDEQKVFLKEDTNTKKQLLNVLYHNHENYKKLLTSLIMKNRTKKNMLEENETYKTLKELELKIQSNENNIYSLQSYINTRANESEFGGLLKECMDLQEKINDEVLKRF